MRYLFVLLILAGCNVEPANRYQMESVGGGIVLRLNTVTGEIERCIVIRAQGICGIDPADDITAARR